jgi:hypothetical protein
MDASPSAAQETLSANLRTILCGLLAAIGGFGLDAARAVAMYRRISGIAGKIERLLTRFRAGRLWRVSRRAGVCSGAFRCAERTLPRRFGWLVRMGGHLAAGYGSQLSAALQTAEMAALLEASPQAVRILRPLCRALAIEMPVFADKPRTPRPKRPRTPSAALAPEPFKIPLPRGVLTWARREGYGKIC